MKTSLLMLLLLAVILLGSLLATNPPAPGSELASAGSASALVPGASTGGAARGTADLREIRAVADSARAAEARLLADLGDAASPDHPAIRRHRLATTVRLLEIQARQAADRGQDGLERRIRANLADLRSVRPFTPAAGPAVARMVEED